MQRAHALLELTPPWGGVCPRLRTTAVDAELAEHAHKLDAKLQRLCGCGFSLFAVHILANPYHFGVN